jgi:hypothetical protein
MNNDIYMCVTSYISLFFPLVFFIFIFTAEYFLYKTTFVRLSFRRSIPVKITDIQKNTNFQHGQKTEKTG